MASRLRGRVKWSLARNERSYREYKLTNLVAVDPGDGPEIAMACPGLPLPYSAWFVGNDLDAWVFCLWSMEVEEWQPKEGDPSQYFLVTQTFTNDPQKRYCRLFQYDDPLLEPQKVNGSSVTYQEEATYDRFGQPLRNSAWEVLRGPQVEFDKNRDRVVIEQNVPLLQYDLCAALRNCVNGLALWNFPPRSIKLSEFTWERMYQGVCFVYYKRRFTFDIRLRQLEPSDFFSGNLNPDNIALTLIGGELVQVIGDWDRDLLDEGTKALYGHWDAVSGHYALDDIGGMPPDNNNPAHFKRFQDRNGDYCRCILNGHGIPWDPDTTGTGLSGPGGIHVEKYNEADFSILNIPLSF